MDSAFADRRVSPRSRTLQNFTVRRKRDVLPGNALSADAQRLFQRVHDAAAAGNLHAHNRDAAHAALFQNHRQFVRVIAFVQLGAADQRDAALHEFLVKAAVGIRRAVRRDQ